MEEELIRKMFRDKLSGKDTFKDSFHLATIKELYLNQPYQLATDKEKTIVQKATFALMIQEKIIIPEDITWKCYLELKLRLDDVDVSKLGSFILSTHKLFEWRKPSKTYTSTQEKQLDEFENICKAGGREKAKSMFYTLSKEFLNTPYLTQLNNIKNKYW